MASKEQRVRLLGTLGSTFAYRVQLALTLKGIEYEYVKEDLKNKSPLLLEANPVKKKVPVLIHGEKPICESVVILEYIEEIWPENPILPKDPYERARARFWAKFIDEKIVSACWTAYSTQGVQQAKALEEAQVALKALEGGIEGKFFSGENIGFLDIVANFIGWWMGALGEAANIKYYDAEKTPLIHSWIQEFRNVEVVKESLPSRDWLVAFFKGHREALLATAISS
ncbi:hypothetical protein AMTRI_Chr09g19210 [Amborella trichopoda]|uniref:glutathione transferase n=1 Tax=Amborella trichopoda TaxID=13333 RepID=W1PLD6_AMBTC|nr:probable glutathione S-transferase [Amborella trichopoda]ERN10817.1 hypothetical protein AMTR_s00027p00235060 [Amborella trichopoda]|eukprot:XP_006849236.1 probable glutathione S-transferase [Amborella trichopoda]